MKHSLKIINEQIRSRVRQIIDSIPLEPAHELIICPVKSKRSINQNSLYWKWIDCIRLHLLDSTGQGYTKEGVHDFLRAKFLPTREIVIAGESKFSVESTTRLSVKEMAEYMTQIDIYCSQSLGLFLPINERDE